MSDTEQRYRLVVLGSGRVGKSSIIRRLLKDEFSEGYKATVEDLHTIIVEPYSPGGADKRERRGPALPRLRHRRNHHQGHNLIMTIVERRLRPPPALRYQR